MSESARTPLIVDTGAFYARADADDQHHETAVRVFESVRDGTLPYGPIYTSHAVLSELATLLLYKLGHEDAARVLTAIRDSESFTVLSIDQSVFDATVAQFVEYDDQAISFVDHATAVLAEEHGVEHVFAFDDDFRTLGLAVVPAEYQRT